MLTFDPASFRLPFLKRGPRYRSLRRASWAGVTALLLCLWGGMISAASAQQPGTISTIGGVGTNGFSGDGGPATEAQMEEPMWLEVDSKGNIFFIDGFHSLIRKFITVQK